MSTWPDVEGALKTYLQARLTTPRFIGFGVPKEANESLFPMVIITRIGGGQDPSEVPLDLATVQFDCWARKDKGRKAEAWAVAQELRGVLDEIRGITQLVSGVRAYGAQVESVIWSPDPGDARARYVITATVTALVPVP